MVGTEWYVDDDLAQRLPAYRRLHRAAFEIVALAAGRLGELALAGQSVIMTTDQSKYLALNGHS